MTRWITTFAATSLVVLSTQTLWSWGQPRIGASNATESSIGADAFPLNDEQGWYTRESYLLWSPHEDDVDWAAKFTADMTSEIEMKTKLKKPDFGWYSGVRLALGRYLPNHDHWDISLISTYYYANTKNHSSPNGEKGGSLISMWSPIAPSFNSSSGQGTWRLNFFTWDLAFGRNLFVSSKITAHPFFSLRSYLIYDNQSARVEGALHSANFDQELTVRFKGYNDSWGIGPRVGSDFTFYLNKFWTIVGSLSGSVLLGSYHVGEEIRNKYVDLITGTKERFNYNVSDHGYDIRSNLEGSIGMGWEKWVSRNRVRIAPSVVFEAAEWFDMNQWIVLRNHSSTSPTQLQYYSSDRKHGDLTFLGFTFNLQVDF